MKHLHLLLFLALNAALPGHAQQVHGSPLGHASPYTGQQGRDIKSLSPEEIKAYTEGQGFGFAKAAELNGYPGPMHTLELAAELDLTEAQRAQSQALLLLHKAEARVLGTQLLEAERALDKAFASQGIDAQTLATLTRDAGAKLAQLRAAHLQTHLAQTALLTPQQIARYKALRGYDTAALATPDMAPPQHHTH
jgi:Spy/CpxP family protein refolding chaperone